MQIRLVSTVLALLATSACVKSYKAPEDRVFSPGRYEYSATLPLPGATSGREFRGTLVLDAVTPDSLAGRWEVTGYDPAFVENRWNVASYDLQARLVSGADTLTLVHDVERGRTPDAPECRVSVTRAGYHEDGTCTLRPVR